MDIVLSIAVLTAIALVLGGIALIRRGVRKQGVLMIVLAAVIAGNVALMTVPVGGAAPESAAPAE